MNKPSQEPTPENDFWDLGDEDLDLGVTIEKPVTQIPAPAPKSQTAMVSEKHEEAHTPAAPIPVVEDTQDTDTPDETTQPVRERIVVEHKPTTMIEKVAIGVFFILLLGAGAWGLTNYYSQAPEGNLVEVTTDFPVKGDIFTVEEISTWWRAPIRKGAHADRGIQLTANLIPCVKLRISGSSSGTIRYAFRDSDQKIIGDSPTLKVVDGKFVKNNSDEITLNCTGGFTDASTLNAYVNQDFNPWVFQFFEAPSGQTPDQNAEPVLKTLIEPIFKENESSPES